MYTLATGRPCHLPEKRFHLRDYQSIRENVGSSDVVVNLIGQDRRTLYGSSCPCTYASSRSHARRNFTMEQVNVQGAGAIARACREAGVPRLIHTSALRARAGALSECSRTKAAGELEVLREFPGATIVRPATLFGTLDRLFNGIGRMRYGAGRRSANNHVPSLFLSR